MNEEQSKEVLSLLRDVQHALNAIPNTKLGLEKYRNTYALASDVDKILEKYDTRSESI